MASLQLFDRIDPLNLGERKWQLLLLSIIAIFVLTVGTVLLAYPAVFSAQIVPGGDTQRQAFTGLCAILAGETI